MKLQWLRDMLWCDHASLQRCATPTSQPQPLRPSQQSVPVLLHNVSIQAAAAAADDDDDGDDEGRPNVLSQSSRHCRGVARGDMGARPPPSSYVNFSVDQWTGSNKVKFVCFVFFHVVSTYAYYFVSSFWGLCAKSHRGSDAWPSWGLPSPSLFSSPIVNSIPNCAFGRQEMFSVEHDALPLGSTWYTTCDVWQPIRHIES